jgi:2-pyrone-4,6-dicarboxylate lactonase
MSEPRPSFHPSPSKPKLRLPPLACDAHVHVFGPARVFPFAPDSPFIPADAPKERLFALHALLGIERCVVVQSTCHGYDNSVTADAIAAKRGSYLGVALVPADVSDAELRRLDAQGFRGARFNFMRHLGRSAPIEDAIKLGDRLARIGWHLQVHFESSLIGELAPWLKRSAVPVVIDHMGRVDASLGIHGVDSDNWYALFTAAKTPRAEIERLNQAVRRALANATVRAKLVASGADPSPSSPEELAALLARDTAKWARVIREKHIQAE